MPRRTLTFPKAAAAVLEPEGFVRQGRNDWMRLVGDYQDLIDLQVSSGLTDITVNVRMLEKSIHALLLEVSAGRGFSIYPVNERVPKLIHGRDQWWKRSDPQGPSELAAAIGEHALPLLERLHSPAGLLAYLEPTIIKWRNPFGRMYAAVLLHRMGRQEDACALLSEAPRLVRGPMLDGLRARLGCEIAAP